MLLQFVHSSALYVFETPSTTLVGEMFSFVGEEIESQYLMGNYFFCIAGGDTFGDIFSYFGVWLPRSCHLTPIALELNSRIVRIMLITVLLISLLYAVNLFFLPPGDLFCVPCILTSGVPGFPKHHICCEVVLHRTDKRGGKTLDSSLLVWNWLGLEITKTYCTLCAACSLFEVLIARVWFLLDRSPCC